MTPLFSQNEFIAKRWLMLAAGPESFGSYDEPENKTEQSAKPTDKEQRSQLADLAGKVESKQDEQVDQNEQEQGSAESNEINEDAGEIAKNNVEKTLGRSERQLNKFDANDPTQGALMQELVKKPSEQVAVDQLDNEELTQRWEQDLVALTRSQVQDIEPGALAG